MKGTILALDMDVQWHGTACDSTAWDIEPLQERVCHGFAQQHRARAERGLGRLDDLEDPLGDVVPHEGLPQDVDHRRPPAGVGAEQRLRELPELRAAPAGDGRIPVARSSRRG